MPRRANPIHEVALTLLCCICLAAFTIELGRLLFTRQSARNRARAAGATIQVTNAPVLFTHPFKTNPYAAPPVTVHP